MHPCWEVEEEESQDDESQQEEEEVGQQGDWMVGQPIDGVGQSTGWLPHTADQVEGSIHLAIGCHMDENDQPWRLISYCDTNSGLLRLGAGTAIQPVYGM